MRRRLFPYPLLSCVVLAMWLLLNQTLAPAHLLLALLLAWAVPLFTRSMQPFPAGSLRRPGLMLRLTVVVIRDVMVSCVNVSRIVLDRSGDSPHALFMIVPLDLRSPRALAVLSTIISFTPGTVWVGLNRDGDELLLHILDLRDRNWWLQTIKQRYEQPLREIFES